MWTQVPLNLVVTSPLAGHDLTCLHFKPIWSFLICFWQKLSSGTFVETDLLESWLGSAVKMVHSNSVLTTLPFLHLTQYFPLQDPKSFKIFSRLPDKETTSMTALDPPPVWRVEEGRWASWNQHFFQYSPLLLHNSEVIKEKLRSTSISTYYFKNSQAKTELPWARVTNKTINWCIIYNE
jgi:hypothetical protein